MPTLAQTADRKRLATPDRAEAIKRRIRSRYPILKDGAVDFIDGRGSDGGFLPGLINRTLKSIKPEPKGITLHAEPKSKVRIFTPEQLREVSERIDANKCSVSPAKSRIVIVEIAPKVVYAYWHLPEASLAGARSRLGDSGRDAALTLRFYDITGIHFDGGNWNNTFDIDIAVEEKQRYIDLWSSDHSYFVDLGLRSNDGRFMPIARSKTVRLPRDEAAPYGEARFLSVEANRLQIARPALPARFAVEQHPILVGQNDRDWELRDLESERKVIAIYRRFSAEGPRVIRTAPAIIMRDPVILRSEFQSRTERLRSQSDAMRKAEAAAAKPQRNADIFFARLDNFRPATENKIEHRDTAILYPPARVATEDRLCIPDFSIALAKRCGRLTETAIPKPAQKPIKRTKTVPMNQLGKALESLRKAGVDLEVELVLRGKVQPGKRVRIGDQIIQPQPDGSFCVSCVVRNGELHVPVAVVEAEMVVAQENISLSIG